MKDPRVDLFALSAQNLSGLPPALVITTDRDVLQSQGGEWCARLQAAGVPSTSIRYQGVMHDFFGLAAVLDKAEHAQQQAAPHVRQAFGEVPDAQPLRNPPIPSHKVIGRRTARRSHVVAAQGPYLTRGFAGGDRVASGVPGSPALATARAGRDPERHGGPR